jgi:hypothetical protein
MKAKQHEYENVWQWKIIEICLHAMTANTRYGYLYI